ncbi:MAG: peptidylprolyl isomerase [Clostridia bacterium]|nr:peptidylprolyl isomerase [Clostridia bacterium]
MANQEKTSAELYREERKARLAKAAKQNKKGGMSKRTEKIIVRSIIAVIVIALVAGIGAFALDQSGIIQRNTVALRVGDETVSQAEYGYYYSSTYSNLYQTYGYYFSYIGFDSTRGLAEQEYTDSLGEIEGFPEDKTPTWADYIDYSTQQSIKYIKANVLEAKKLGLTLGEKENANIEKTIADYEEQVVASSQQAGLTLSFSAYLENNFGKGVNKKVLVKILEDSALAQMVQEKKEAELADAVTDKQIEKEYKSNLENYGVVTLRNYAVVAETVKSTDEEGNETNEATKETLKAAKAKAEAFAAKATDVETFKQLASESEKEAGNKDYKDFLTEDSLSLSTDIGYSDLSYSSSDEDFLEWAFDKKTEVNSTYVTENDEGYLVCMMVEPVHKMASYNTFDSRHILIKFADETASTTETAEESEEETTAAEGEETKETEETTEAETTQAAKEEVKVETIDLSKYEGVNVDLVVNAETAKNKTSYKKIQEVLEKYLEGEHTAEAFGLLAEEYSEDGGSNTNGGLYEGTKAGEFVPAYNDWCVAEGRKEGDLALVEYDGENYSGYHLIYYVGQNEVTWKDGVRDALVAADLEEYVAELVESETVAVSDVSTKATEKVHEFFDTLLKQSAQQSAEYSY